MSTWVLETCSLCFLLLARSPSSVVEPACCVYIEFFLDCFEDDTVGAVRLSKDSALHKQQTIMLEPDIAGL